MTILSVLLVLIVVALFVYELVSLIRTIANKRQSKINKNKEKNNGNSN